MLREFSTPSFVGTAATTFKGLKTITINVIGAVCFGTQRSWTGTKIAETPPGFKTTFIDSISTIVDNWIFVLLVPAKIMRLPFLPKSVRKVGTAITEFPLHLRESISKERKGPSSRNTLIASLVRLADRDQDPSLTTSTSTYLSEEEIRGNLFTFTIAGFETTANTLAYAVAELAANLEWQDWIGGEIDETRAGYLTGFPKLTRCLALMVLTPRSFSTALKADLTPVPVLDAPSPFSSTEPHSPDKLPPTHQRCLFPTQHTRIHQFGSLTRLTYTLGSRSSRLSTRSMT